MVDYEVMTSKRDFDDLLEGTNKKRSSAHFDLSLQSRRPSLSRPDFSFKGLGRISSFDSIGGCRLLPFRQDVSLAQMKRPLRFHEKVMHFFWYSLVSLQMRIGKWPLEHAILIDYLH
jgi:hypothetical protein